MSLPFALEFLAPSYAGARIACMEHLLGLSRECIRHFTGRDPLAEPQHLNAIFRELTERLDIDLLWGGGLPANNAATFDWATGPRVRKNAAGEECIQWGIFATTHQEDGRHFTGIPKPASVDAALALDPLALFPDTIDQYTERFTRQYARDLESCGDSAYPIPHHYTTCFHGPLALFGFELLCEAGMEEDRFSTLMTRFAEISRRVTTAWSRVRDPQGHRLQAFICHDDLTMTSGPLFSPAWYRRHIFPHYRAIFAPLQAAGIPVIFTSDGDPTAFIDDILGESGANADGFNFEYLVDLQILVDKYPNKILIGNLNSGTLARGPIAAIEAELTRAIAIGKHAPRFVINVGGGLTHDIPPAHLEAYLKLRKHLCRTARS